MRTEAQNRKGTKALPASRFRISEIYWSVQGEGLLTGTPSLFVRTSGCNLRCWFCDTPFASWEPEGRHLSLPEILARCQALEAPGQGRSSVVGQSHVVLTGGEPMIFKQLPELCRALKYPDPASDPSSWQLPQRHLTIETAGTVYRQVVCDLMSISPKLSGSAPKSAAATWSTAHHRRRERLDIVRGLMGEHPYQLKFVVDCPADAMEVLDYLARLGDFDGQRVLLMPQGTEQAALTRQAEWLLPWCQQHGLRFCPRAHIEWFGNRRGT
jgi:7-carboxy-7-deazaguanine synthase